MDIKIKIHDLDGDYKINNVERDMDYFGYFTGNDIKYLLDNDQYKKFVSGQTNFIISASVMNELMNSKYVYDEDDDRDFYPQNRK